MPPVLLLSDHIVSLLRFATTGRCSVIKFCYKAKVISADDFDYGYFMALLRFTIDCPFFMMIFLRVVRLSRS